MAHLVQPLDRLGQGTSAVEGTVIRLVVSKQLVELMGGLIGEASTASVDSMVWIELNVTDGLA